MESNTFHKGISNIYLLLFLYWLGWEQGRSRKNTSPGLQEVLSQAKMMLLIKS